MGYINFVRCQLAASITSTDTSITLSSNTSPFNLPPTDGGTLVLADSINKPSKLEIITYTSRSGLVLTGVVRGAEGTTAQSWPSSSYCYMSFTALMLTSFKADMAAALQTVVNKQDKHANLTALSGITSGTGLFKRASDGSWVLDTTQYSTVTLASAIPLAGTASGSVGTSLKAAKEDHTHPLQTSVSGNASTATKLASPISFTFTGGATGSLSSFDGSSNVTITLTVDANGHTHGLATSLVNGLMSSAQFTKLAGIADNANNYVHPTGAGYSHIPTSGTNVNRFLKSGTNDTYSWSLLSKTDVGLSNVDNTADADKPLSTAATNALLNKVNTSSVGVAGGLATLDTNTQVPSSQLPNASSNTYGVVKLSTDTVNASTANALSSTANRTYQIQRNTGGSLVVNIPWTDTVYTHPTSGIAAGTYKVITVDTNGHVVSGSNPTTLAGFGITDAAPSNHVGATGNAHGVASSSVNGFMSSTDKSKLDNLNLSTTTELVGSTDSGIKPIYTSAANAFRAGSNITLSITDGTALTSSRNHHGSTSKVESYLQNTSTFTQDLFGVSGYSYLYGGSSSTSNDGNLYGGYYVATAACTSTSNKYVAGVAGLYGSATVDVTNSIVSRAYGIYADISVTGTTNPTGSITNAYGLYISLTGVNPYATNIYSIYCSEYNALGYLAGGLSIGTAYPNNTDGGIILKNGYLYLWPKGKNTGTYYGIDVGGIIAGNNADYVQQHEYGIKFGNAYSASRESSDPQTIDWYEEISTSLTSSGLTTNTSATAKLTRNGDLVAIDVPTITGAGTATTFKLTGIPIQCRPLVTKEFLVRGTVGGVVSICRAIINTSGEIQVYAGLNSETFSTTSSTRGINKISLSYQLH